LKSPAGLRHEPTGEDGPVDAAGPPRVGSAIPSGEQADDSQDSQREQKQPETARRQGREPVKRALNEADPLLDDVHSRGPRT